MDGLKIISGNSNRPLGGKGGRDISAWNYVT